ncbi:TetR/AcrR family transcriptional regulator [Streptomyces longwoodensis]|uniref:TetR/AcrR family transcriptional regulator n=1 Tax=Streptomyces longwoodensis TaxID=68231 RepID=UPI0033C0BF8C
MSVHPSTSLSGRRFDEGDLLDAARAVFHADGYAAEQIADIARRAGTIKPTFYARLGNKEQIYLHVVEREAEVFRQSVADAYERGSRLPLAELSQVGMEPLFRFASERAEGFDLLFRGERTGDRPATLRRQVVNGVTEQLTGLIKRRSEVFGSALGPHAEALAAACVGVALQVCEHTIDRGGDLNAARHLAARFVENAFQNLDFDTLNP